MMAQQDPKLQERLNLVMQATRNMDIEKILDLSYPKLFELAPREAVAEAMKAAFETEEFSTTLDSVNVTKVFPAFTVENGQFAKITHSMLMRMRFKEEIDSASLEEMMPLMEDGFGKGNVRFDKANNTFVVKDNSELVAVKDEHSAEWTFVNYEPESELAALLFSDAVIEKLKQYK